MKLSGRKRLLALLVAVPVALAALLAAAALLIPADRIAAAAAERAEAALDRDVGIEAVSLRLLPRPSVTLRDVVIGGPRSGSAGNGVAAPAVGSGDAVEAAAAGNGAAAATGPEVRTPPFATAQRVQLRPRLLPLLRGRVVIDAIELDRPRLLLETDETGALDLPGAETDAGEGDLEFLIRQIRVRDGRAGYRDGTTGTVVRLDGIDQRIRIAGQIREGRLERIGLDGVLDVAGFSADLPGRLAVPIRDVGVRVVHRAALEDAGDRLRLDGLAVRVREIALDGRGEIRGLASEGPFDLDLELGTEPFDIGRLFDSLPEAWRDAASAGLGGAAPILAGRARVEARVSGRAGNGEVPELDARIELDDVGFARRGAREPLLAELAGSISVSLDGASADGLTGRLLGEPMRASFAIRDPAAPVVRFAIRTAVDLGRARAAGLVGGDADARGRIEVDLAGRGPLLEPASLELDGSMSLAGVTAATPALAAPLEVVDGRLVFRGRELSATGLDLRIGESDLAIEATAAEWLPLALGQPDAPQPTVRVDARSRRFLADAAFAGESVGYGELLFARLMDRPVGGRTAAQAADEAGLRLPAIPPVDLQARFRAEQAVQSGLDLRDVDVTLAGRDGQLELRGGSFQLLGGAVRLTGRIGMADDGTHPLTLHFEVRDVGAAPFFQTLTPFRERLTGSLVLAGSAAMLLDGNLLPVRETIAGEGTIAILEGQLANWPLFRGLGRELELARFDTLSFRDWHGRFSFAGTRVALAETVLEAGDVTVLAAGWFDFSGALDLGATVRLPRDWLVRSGARFAPQLAAIAAGDDGRLPLGVKAGGTFDSPSLRLDLSEAAGAVADRIREEAEREARTLAERAAAEAAERVRQEAEARLAGDTAALPRIVPAADSLAAAADSARQRLEAELRRRLRPRPPERR